MPGGYGWRQEWWKMWDQRWGDDFERREGEGRMSCPPASNFDSRGDWSPTLWIGLSTSDEDSVGSRVESNGVKMEKLKPPRRLNRLMKRQGVNAFRWRLGRSGCYKQDGESMRKKIRGRVMFRAKSEQWDMVEVLSSPKILQCLLPSKNSLQQRKAGLFFLKARSDSVYLS